MANNSFAENLANLTQQSAEVVSLLEGINESMAGNDSEVKISEETTLPSYSNIIKRVDRAENTISKFVQGKGVIESDDGTFRKIKVSTISKPPTIINEVGTIGVSTFGINPNWFFESLQYPRCVIKINLKDHIEDNASRVYVNRVIIDSSAMSNSNGDAYTIFTNEIQSANLGYTSLIALLEKYGIPYKEDKDEVKLPLTYEKFRGEFGITEIKLLKDEQGKSQQWFYLDNIDYSLVDENGLETSVGLILNVGQYLRYENSLYKIIEINQNQKRVRLDYAVGYETLGVGNIVELYNEPFSEKILEIGIGINELDVIYLKGINDEYNLLGKDWSAPITLYTNDLLFEENDNVTFLDYYKQNVADFGKKWIAQIKEGQIYSSNGLQPNVPVLNSEDLNVVQINTQLDATLDKDTYNKLTTQIASTKSNIAAVRSTIASNKDILIQSPSEDERMNIQNTINTDTDKLNSLTTQYNSLIDELNTLLNESGAINYTPKYHIRGFFAVPDSRYDDEENKVGEQVIIGFETMYRYLHTDETGIKLDSYEYTDGNNIIQTGVFTDWNIMQSSLLSKVLNEETGLYEWSSENTADGSQININQIDIPIQVGEKVEIKVRSISEAGYPYNPLKSAWSNSVIISFPDNLTSDDNVTTMLNSVKNDMNTVILQETLSAAGVYTHLSDTNSTYKHSASNISYTDASTSEGADVTTLSEISVQNKLDSITKQIAIWEKTLKEEILTSVEKQITDTNTKIQELGEKIDANGSYAQQLSDLSKTVSDTSTFIDNLVSNLHDSLSEIRTVLGYSGTSVKYDSSTSVSQIGHLTSETNPVYLSTYKNVCDGFDVVHQYVEQIANAFGITTGLGMIDTEKDAESKTDDNPSGEDTGGGTGEDTEGGGEG